MECCETQLVSGGHSSQSLVPGVSALMSDRTLYEEKAVTLTVTVRITSYFYMSCSERKVSLRFRNNQNRKEKRRKVEQRDVKY